MRNQTAAPQGDKHNVNRSAAACISTITLSYK